MRIDQTKAKRGKRVHLDYERRMLEAANAMLSGYQKELEVGHDKYWYPDRWEMIEHKWGRFYR